MDSIASELDTAMLIVTTAAEGERSGCLVGFHTQSSIDPMRWAIWISKANHTFGVVTRASHVAVHFPSEDDHEIASLFGEETGDEVDKFSACEWREGPGGVPLLDAIVTRFVGENIRSFDDGGDHLCLTMDVGPYEHPGRLRPLRFTRVQDLDAGHPAEEAAS